MTVITLIITHEGWYGICPCWFTNEHEINGILSPVPKYKLWPLLYISDFIFHFVFMFMVNPVFPARIRRISEPFLMRIRTK